MVQSLSVLNKVEVHLQKNEDHQFRKHEIKSIALIQYIRLSGCRKILVKIKID